MRSNKEILFVFEPGNSGVFVHVEYIVRYFIRQRTPVHLYFSSLRSSVRLENLVADVIESGGEVFDMKIPNRPAWRDIPILFRLASFLFRKRSRLVVHCHSFKGGFIGRITAYLMKVNAVFYTPNAYYGMRLEKGFGVWVNNFIERVLGNIGYTINVSSSEMNFAQNYLGISQSQCFLNLNSVQVPVQDRHTNDLGIAFRDSLNLPKSACVLGTIGRFTTQKNPKLLYESLTHVCGIHNSVYLIHIGTGEHKEQCLNIAKKAGFLDRVRILDEMEDVSSFFNSIDCYVMTSIYEGLSYAVLEALSYDLPLVLSDCPGNDEFMKYKFPEVWYFSPTSPDELSHSFLNNVFPKVPNDNWGNRSVLEKEFSLKKNCRRIEKLCDLVTDRQYRV
ncbi:glycosyltransferase family 4 protein [bacterium]|nr:glycosyltransferase family 4 protein [bacterium]